MILYSEYRLIERETEISIAWKGIHLLLFFLAFLFGSFCTFCFHMISYMFDEQCVLFPKLLTLNKERNSMLYSFLPLEGSPADWPVDFITTQWVEKNVCVLPMFIPLVSGIFGLVWTTMFVMCTSAMSQHGLQRPWRLMVPVLLFSLIMSAVCVYTSIVTQAGMNELCVKLGQATGSSGCSYTINVISLAYSRRIRGVYQATWLIVLSAWLHTICWVLAAIVALLRIGLAVDFHLICVTATLEGNYEKLLQQNESQIRLTEPELSASALADNADFAADDRKESKTKTHLFFQGIQGSASESTLISPSSLPSRFNNESIESLQPETSVGHKKTLSSSNIAPKKALHSDVSVRRRPFSDDTLNARLEAKAPDWIKPARSSLKDKRSSRDLPGSHHVSIREPKPDVQIDKDKKKKDTNEKKKDALEKKQDEHEKKGAGHENKKDQQKNKEDGHEKKKDEDDVKKDRDENKKNN